MSDLPTLEAFDVPDAVARMLDQPAIWRQALVLFVRHFADWEAAWTNCVGRDAEEVQRVHALRSGAANVGAKDLAVVAGQLEDVLRHGGGQAASVDALRRQLREEYGRAWRAAAAFCRHASPEAMP
nr:Hpt domain-containing protein [Dechloromonas sp.]